MNDNRQGVGEKVPNPIVQEPLAQIQDLPSGYAEFLEELKERIRQSQLKAAVSVNRELILLYWNIGQRIVEQQDSEGWGKNIIEQLAADLQIAFPGVKGFSPRNLWRMRAFYLEYSTSDSNLPQAVAELTGKKLPQAVAEIPWGHNILLMEKVKDREERFWYIQMTIEHGWSRNVLVHQIESGLYQRKGKAITNFPQTLPPLQSDLAQETLKDPYSFDFLTLAEDVKERDLERQLIHHIREFLIELGVGFAFVGSQVHMEVGDRDFYLDLLFYHLKLRCFIVIDLKTGEFRPEYAGKMNFYLSAVDDLYRHPDDQASIGIILCKHKNRVIVEYALRDTSKPIGVSAYMITQELPKELQSSLPSVEEIEEELHELEMKKNE